MAEYSASKLRTFKNCPLKYKFNYIDKIRTGKTGIEAFLGSRVHDVLEQLYNDLRLCKTNSLDDLLALFEGLWEKEYHDDIVIMKEGYTAENYRELGRKCIRNYYQRYQPFDQATNLGTELKINFCLDGNDAYRLKGYIDRLDQRVDGTYEIHDYKTSPRLPDEKKFDGDRQLCIYQMAVASKFADAQNVELIWHYPALDKEYRVIMDEDCLAGIKAEIKELIDEIEAATEFAPKETGLCNWCDYQELCPTRKHLCQVEQLPANEYLKEDGVVLVNRFAALKDQKKELEGEIEKVEEALWRFCSFTQPQGQ
ncbi:MAG: RecB family exonuclease [Thermoleophilia bacterium]